MEKALEEPLEHQWLPGSISGLGRRVAEVAETNRHEEAEGAACFSPSNSSCNCCSPNLAEVWLGEFQAGETEPSASPCFHHWSCHRTSRVTRETAMLRTTYPEPAVILLV